MHHQQNHFPGTGTKTFHQPYLKGTAQADGSHVHTAGRPVQTEPPPQTVK